MSIFDFERAVRRRYGDINAGLSDQPAGHGLPRLAGQPKRGHDVEDGHDHQQQPLLRQGAQECDQSGRRGA